MIKENKGFGMLLLAAGALAILTRKKTYVFAATATHFVEVNRKTKEPITVGSAFTNVPYQKNQYVGEAVEIEKANSDGKYPVGKDNPYILVRTPSGIYHWLPSDPGYLVNLSQSKK